MTSTDGAGPAEARTWKLHPDLPCEWQEPKCLSHHLLLSKMCVSRKLELEEELYSTPGPLVRDVDISNLVLNMTLDTCPCRPFFGLFPSLAAGLLLETLTPVFLVEEAK